MHVQAETELRKAEMEEIRFLEERLGKEHPVVKEKILKFVNKNRVNELINLENIVAGRRNETGTYKKSRLRESSDFMCTPTSSVSSASNLSLSSSFSHGNHVMYVIEPLHWTWVAVCL